jgi:peptidoglycan/LPS O-acetylase OafA/YrhL
MRGTMTVGDRIKTTGGFTSGFDYIRLILSVMVMFGHSFLISGDLVFDKVLPFGSATIVGYSILPMFFALSGFLVAASLIRTQSLLVFLTLRGLRILPALMVEICLSALVLGPLLTAGSLHDYFTHIEFFQYFLNIIGYIHYHLPGVFVDNPVPRTVNGSLWTVPYEAECYLALAALSLVGLVRRPKMFVSIFVVLILALFVWTFMHVDTDPTRTTASGRQLVLFFLAGVLVYLFRDSLPFSGGIALIAAVVSLALVASHTAIFLLPLPVAYVTMYLGLQTPKKLPLIFTGDYSYGIYLYAYPMQQAVVHLLPKGQSWYTNFLLALLMVCLFAAFSWHCIEKPMLKLKRFILRKTETKRHSKDELISPDRAVANA